MIHPNKNYKILAIDGGGVRGIMPASFLNYFQERLGNQNPIYGYFDLIVGTSTGGIIALAIALGVSTNRILALYKERSKKIFQRTPRAILNGLITPKYGNQNLILELKDLFGEQKLSEAKTSVCIPAVDVVNGKTIVFKTNHHQDYVNDFMLPVWKIAAATSAAPGYLPPFYDSKFGAFIDGGIWSNNPSLIGIAEAIKLGNSYQCIKVLSLGTGVSKIYKSQTLLKKFGLLGWGSTIVDMTMQAQSQSADNIAKYLLCDTYKRIEFSLPNHKFNLDSTKKLEDLEILSLQKAKESFADVKRDFFELNNHNPERK